MRIDPVYLYIPKDSTTSIGECIERAYKAWKKAPTESKKFVSEKMPIIAKRAIQVVLYMCCNNADIIFFRRGSLSGSSKIRHRYGEVSQFEIGNNIVFLKIYKMFL